VEISLQYRSLKEAGIFLRPFHSIAKPDSEKTGEVPTNAKKKAKDGLNDDVPSYKYFPAGSVRKGLDVRSNSHSHIDQSDKDVDIRSEIPLFPEGG
jgi:hypothetical protein